MNLLRSEKDPSRQKLLTEFISSYLTRVENVKNKMNANKLNNNKPSNFDYTAEATLKKKSNIPNNASNNDNPDKLSVKHLHIENLITEALDRGKSKAKTNTSTATNSSNANTNNKPSTNPTATTTTTASLSEYEVSIMNELVDKSPGILWEDIAGLAQAKQILQEAVVLPNLRPDLFTGMLYINIWN